MIKVSTKIILIALQKALYCLAETQREVLTTSVEKHWNDFFFFIFIKKIKIYFKKLLIFKIYFCKLKKYILFFFSKILAFQYTLKFEFKKSSAKRPQRRRARRNGCYISTMHFFLSRQTYGILQFFNFLYLIKTS